jgi:hypothetical protein
MAARDPRSPIRHGSIVPSKRVTFVSHLVAQAVLAKVLPRFEADGIVALPVKGIVTGGELYADVTERPITDIDLRVVPERLEDVARIVTREGWQRVVYSRAYGNIGFRVDRFSIDVETTVGPPGLCSLRVADMITRATRTPPPISQLRPEIHDHAILLCVNVFKDKITRAAPWALRDVELIVARPDFVIDEFIARVQVSRVVSLVWIVADWMATARESARWAAVRDRLGPSPRPLYARLYRTLLARDDDSLPLRLLARAGSDAKRERARALWTAMRWEIERRRA